MHRARLLLPALAAVACASPEATAPPPPEADAQRAEVEPEERPPAPAPAARPREQRPEPEPIPPTPGDSPARQRELEKRLLDATRDENYERADMLLGQLKELRIEADIEQVSHLLDVGDPETALVVAETALVEVPTGPAIRAVHGEAALRVGRRLHDDELLEAALTSFLGAYEAAPKGTTRETRTYFRAHVLQRAVVAARAMGRKERALEIARLQTKVAGEADDGKQLRRELPEWPERTFSESCFDVYADVREEDPERAAELASELERPLERMMRRRSRDPWAWSMLARLYVLEERLNDAIDVAEPGLARFPEEERLAGHLADAARGAGGSSAVLIVFADFREKHPESPLAWWYPAWERFDRAIATPERDPRWYPEGGKLSASPSDLEQTWIEELTRAEADFRQCRELEPAYAPACLTNEARCRGARGWVHLAAGDTGAARDEFLSMEELFPGGMRCRVDGLLLDGVFGLGFVADAHANRDELRSAAEVFGILHAYEPDDPNLANDAGYWHREAGSRMQNWGADAARLARGDLGDRKRVEERLAAAGLELPPAENEAATRAALEQAAGILEERSRQLFETSYTAYLRASELAPEDVRVVNDTALIAVYHLGRDLDRAEDYLLRCVKMGEAQLEMRELDDEARRELTEAWGDAHQNLGVLYFDFRDDPQTARAWFEKSVEIGPYPRPLVTEDYLPRCELGQP